MLSNPFTQLAPPSLDILPDPGGLTPSILPELLEGSVESQETPHVGLSWTYPPDTVENESLPCEVDLLTGVSSHSSTGNRQGNWIQVCYYSRFHKAHPFLPPEGSLGQLYVPRYLMRVMEFIALHYMVLSAWEHESNSIAEDLVDVESSIYKAQAYLLLAILSHSKGQPSNARQYNTMAVKIALDIRLYCRDFGAEENEKCAIFYESARRTWWELVIIDGLLAGLQMGGSLAIDTDLIGIGDVLLPCAEDIYSEESCVLSKHGIRDLRNRYFADQDIMFSSFAYRIDAALMFRDVVRAVRNTTRISLDVFQTLDSRTMSWFYHLPADEHNVLRSDGTIDQMLFQAHLLTHCSIIYLNLPHSYLLSSLVTANGLICGSPGASSYISPGTSHTAKTIQAAVDISNLSGLSRCYSDHTPFLTCFLVLSSIVHLGSCSISTAGVAEKHRSLLALNIGILKSLGTTWPLALQSKNHLNQAAREIMGIA
jgi:hypothetical protein